MTSQSRKSERRGMEGRGSELLWVTANRRRLLLSEPEPETETRSTKSTYTSEARGHGYNILIHIRHASSVLPLQLEDIQRSESQLADMPAGEYLPTYLPRYLARPLHVHLHVTTYYC